MKFKEATIGFGTLALAISASYATAQTPPPLSDAAFVQAAQMGNDEEIADARYMLGQSKNPGMRTFENTLISDHSSANVALLRAARAAHVPAPQAMRRDTTITAPDALRGLSGKPLHDAYLTTEIRGHEKMLATLKAEEASSSADPALKAYATEQEPAVQRHLDAANNLMTTGSAATPGAIAPNSSGAPSPITTQQTNGSVPTDLPVSNPGPSAAPTSGGSPQPTTSPIVPGPTHAP